MAKCVARSDGPVVLGLRQGYVPPAPSPHPDSSPSPLPQWSRRTGAAARLKLCTTWAAPLCAPDGAYTALGGYTDCTPDLALIKAHAAARLRHRLAIFTEVLKPRWANEHFRAWATRGRVLDSFW